ncbi:hypothetical protein CYLTODRAFT_411441 [Cylindrobasidium torrendii FP15055 ss-10]|uniref:Uncharacterized protein n=1 Tax=Cylindrobasidium torrendii FP15055 ss-10 TaxID=1314674 RepID=A0A0D7B955_9AGAR|nr:hypothetical protein CYLTODRAFT_411441 [Cylindrobasidium torrendii FP15055 ss-10]
MSLTPFTDRASIQSLPNEIKATIFEFVIFEATKSRSFNFQIGGGLPPQLILMAVCTDWAGLCIDLPELWTRISIALLPARPARASDWNQFAVACERALGWSRLLSLDLELEHWHLNDDSIQTASYWNTVNGGRVFDSTGLSLRILQFSIQQCERWKSFAMLGYDDDMEAQPRAGIPWRYLVNVTNLIPKLQTISFTHLWQMPPSAPQPRTTYLDTFLVAPSLSVASFNACFAPLNLPWAQLTEINVDTVGFVDFHDIANYFVMLMRRTTAHTVSWSHNMDFHDIVDGIFPADSTIENPHIVKLELIPMMLPKMRLPNLTDLEFTLTGVSEDFVDTVSGVTSLLKDSHCRLLVLTLNHSHSTEDIRTVAPLLPYLGSLQSLTCNAILHDADIALDLLEGLRDLLVATTFSLPKLTTLTVNLAQSTREQDSDSIDLCVLDAFHAEAVWQIVQTRMLAASSSAVKLEHFLIELVAAPSGTRDPIEASDGGFQNSSAGRNIMAAGVDFKLKLPAQTSQVVPMDE